MSTTLINKLNQLFDVNYFAELLKEGDDRKFDRELHLAVAEFNLHSNRVEFEHSPLSVCVRLFALLVGRPEMTKPLQHLFTRYRMHTNFPVYGGRPTFLDALTCAALGNNIEMIRFLFKHGAVLHHPPAGILVLRNLLCDRRNVIGIEAFRHLVERMVLPPAMPTYIETEASAIKLCLSSKHMQVLMQQGAEFGAWKMSLWADSVATLQWMIQNKYIDTSINNSMVMLLQKYVAGNDHRPYLLDIIHEILRHITVLNTADAKEKALLGNILELCQLCGTTEDSVERGFDIAYHLVFNIIGVKNLAALTIGGYPILIYCASKGYERLCKAMVEMGLNKKIFKSNMLFNTDSGESVARAAGFTALADWFAEPVIPMVGMLPQAPSTSNTVRMIVDKKFDNGSNPTSSVDTMEGVD